MQRAGLVLQRLPSDQSFQAAETHVSHNLSWFIHNAGDIFAVINIKNIDILKPLQSCPYDFGSSPMLR